MKESVKHIEDERLIAMMTLSWMWTMNGLMSFGLPHIPDTSSLPMAEGNKDSDDPTMMMRMKKLHDVYLTPAASFIDHKGTLSPPWARFILLINSIRLRALKDVVSLLICYVDNMLCHHIAHNKPRK